MSTKRRQGTARVAIHVYTPSTLSARSPHDNKRRCAHWAGRADRQHRAPLSLSLQTMIHDYKGRDYCSHTTRPGRLPLTGESWAGESLRSGSGCGCAVRKPRSGTCGSPWNSVPNATTVDGPAVHLVSARTRAPAKVALARARGTLLGDWWTLVHSRSL